MYAAAAAAAIIIIIVIIVFAGFASSPVVSQYLGPYRAEQPGFCSYIFTSKSGAFATVYSTILVGSFSSRYSLAISCPPGSLTHPTFSFVTSQLSRPF